MKRIIGLSLIVCMMTLLCGCGVYISERPAQERQQDASGTKRGADGKVDLDAIMASVEKMIPDDFKPQLGIVLGSGLGALADEGEGPFLQLRY